MILVIDGADCIAEYHEVVGRGHAERLVPAVGHLLEGRKPTAICVDCGPGSFTGLRVGLAAARAFGLAWGVPVTGYSATAILAAAAFQRYPDAALATVQMGGHGELFVEAFRRDDLATTMALASLTPEEARRRIGGLRAVGSGASLVGREDAAWPRAADLLLLPDERRSLPPRPIYGRAADARPQ
jgi:tRNA threonylcarbamoyl adenosine modification protein YeaZ